MSTRWLVIVVVSVFIVVLGVTLALTGDDKEPVPVPTPAVSPSGSPPAGSPATSPSSSASSTSSPSPSPSPSASSSPATGFSASGDLVSGWYWLRDDAYAAAATWTFATIPASGDLVLEVEVLATDEVDGAGGQDARFFLAWAPAPPADAASWSGRRPVTLPNVSAADDPVGYTCRGTVTIPRSTLSGATTLAVRISRDDVRDELEPVDVHVAVNASSVRLRFP
jgi:hypothetical protein